MTALVIEGEAGIGKTTLWSTGVEHARDMGMTVLSASPAEPEEALPYTVLGDLLLPELGDRVAALPPPLASALEIALQRRVADEPAAQVAVSRATVAVLESVSSPLLVALDDVQWIDVPSERTLEYSLRRLADRQVRVLLTRRSEDALSAPLSLDRALPFERLATTRLGPMNLSELDELLRRRLDLRLPRPDLIRLRDTSGGNPFYALEIAREGVGDDLRIPPTLAAAIQTRLDAMTPDVRSAVLLAAAARRPTVRIVALAAGSTDALAGAVDAGVLVIDGERLRFSHPLLASVAYESAAPWERRDAHERLARTSDDEVERAEHLAGSTEEPDEPAAAELESAASMAARRGAPDTAGRLAEEAARLTPAAGRARGRLEHAADYYIAAGDPGRGRAILERLLEDADEGRDRAAILYRLADTIGDTLDEPIRLCEQALVEAGDDQPLLAEIHNTLATFTWLAGDLARSTDHVRSVSQIAGEIGDERLEAVAIGELCHAQAVLGEPWDRPAMDRALEIERRIGDLPASSAPSFQLAVISVYTDEHEVARPLLQRWLETLREQGDEPGRATVLFRLTELELRAGNWGRALGHARLAAELTRQAGIEQEQYVTTMSLAAVLAHLGSLAEAHTLARAAFELAEGAGDRVVAQRCAGVLGFVELSSGDAVSALEWLVPALRELKQMGTGELSISGVAQNAIEALVRCGRLDEAEAAIALVELRGAPTDRAWHRVVAERGRALVDAERADIDAARVHVAAALEAAERLPQPFELARTFLAAGQIERRGQNRRGARDTLEQALELFDQLGAAAWAERGAAELARVPGRRRRAGTELTETERRVAELAAAGRANKEIAADLFITVRTVEANLTRVYRKLGIRSRVDLARSLPPQ